MLVCGTRALGSREYSCSNAQCSHRKSILQTCNSKACPSCGMKATEQWIENQKNRLPECEWQHTTLTMPDALWDVFMLNR